MKKDLYKLKQNKSNKYFFENEFTKNKTKFFESKREGILVLTDLVNLNLIRHSNVVDLLNEIIKLPIPIFDSNAKIENLKGAEAEFFIQFEEVKNFYFNLSNFEREDIEFPAFIYNEKFKHGNFYVLLDQEDQEEYLISVNVYTQDEAHQWMHDHGGTYNIVDVIDIDRLKNDIEKYLPSIAKSPYAVQPLN